jgi:hypothetical protein
MCLYNALSRIEKVGFTEQNNFKYYKKIINKYSEIYDVSKYKACLYSGSFISHHSFQHYNTFEGYTIDKVNFPEDYIVIIYIKNNNTKILQNILNDDVVNIIDKYLGYKKLQLEAEADCCSESWLELPDGSSFNNIVGKEILSIEKYKGYIDLPESGKQEYDKNNLFNIILTDGTVFPFYLRNSSNGYYSGWLNITVKE